MKCSRTTAEGRKAFENAITTNPYDPRSRLPHARWLVRKGSKGEARERRWMALAIEGTVEGIGRCSSAVA